MIAGIYSLVSPSGKIYIGQSKDIQSRKYQYKAKNCKNQTILFRSLQKYGFQNHKFDILHELPFDISQEILDNYEELYIKQYREVGLNLMNIRDGGKGGGKGQRMTEEEKEKLRMRMIGNKYGVGIKANLGRKHSKITRDKRAKMWESGKYDTLLVPIKCNETGESFKSIKECEKLMNLPLYSDLKISQSLSGKRKKKEVAGFTFSHIK